MRKFPDGAAVLAAIVMSCHFLMEACFSHWKEKKLPGRAKSKFQVISKF